MGSKSSSSPVNTASTYNDSRQVNDAGGGVAGVGNQWDQSISSVDNSSTTWTQSTADNRTNTNSGNTTWNSDSSDRSTTNWTQSTADNRTNTNSGNTSWTDGSTTTWNSDSSDRSTTTWNQTSTDGGAILAMRDVSLSQSDTAKEIARISAASAKGAADAAIRAQENALAAVTSGTNGALDFAKTSSAQAYKTSADALGFASDGFGKLVGLTSGLLGSAQKQADQAASTAQAAYSSAASQANGNKTLTIAALAVVGVIGAVLIFKRA